MVRSEIAFCARALAGLGALVAAGAGAATLEVPAQFPTVQTAIDAAGDGATIRVAPGTYVENLVIQGKHVTLVSHFAESHDPAHIAATILDGGGGILAVVHITADAGSGATIQGFTLQNADQGVLPEGPVEFLNGRVWNTRDGIGPDGATAIIRDSVFEQNSDDGIDLDHGKETLIERNRIQDNGQDGIEIRLHDGFVGPAAQITIRDNVIQGNDGDGIQFIDYYTLTPRTFRIEGNVIAGNAQAGVGMLCCETSDEDFQGAPIEETVILVDNTFAGNDHGLAGGANVVAVNNLFVDHTTLGVKNSVGSSIVAESLFFGNGADVSNSNVELATTLFEDPLLDAGFTPLGGSPVIDAGTAFFEVGGEVVLDLEPGDYAGAAPDLGAVEFVPEPGSLLARLAALLGLGRLARGRGKDQRSQMSASQSSFARVASISFAFASTSARGTGRTPWA